MRICRYYFDFIFEIYAIFELAIGIGKIISETEKNLIGIIDPGDNRKLHCNKPF